jgi:purine-binding chemotaxis protein CheW
VEEVANIAASDIEQTPDFGVQIETAYILGMAKIKGVVKALLDIDRVLAAQSVEALSGL